MRAVSRIADVSINTVAKLLAEAGNACALYHDEHVVNVSVQHVQCDAIWSFSYATEKTLPKAAFQDAGDAWTWTALDRDSRLIIAYEVRDRSAAAANKFVAEIRKRLANPVQLTTDGHKVYLEAVNDPVGADADFALLVEIYGDDTGQGNPPGYSPAESHIERQNLSTPIGMRQSTRLTNAFSKKLASRVNMLSLYFLHCSFVQSHKSLGMTPAMAAGLSSEIRDMEWIVSLTDALAPKPNRPAVYRKIISN